MAEMTTIMLVAAVRGNPALIPAAPHDRSPDSGAGPDCQNPTRSPPEPMLCRDVGRDAFLADIDRSEDASGEGAPCSGAASAAEPVAGGLYGALGRLWRRVFPPLTTDEADLLARVKFPCC